ncbi:MAG TPA: PepSY domain-containing protein [Chthonomonadales bacterium]|nr:PepSY domain-containing protein [Chthonomonadales bacterium]
MRLVRVYRGGSLLLCLIAVISVIAAVSSRAGGKAQQPSGKIMPWQAMRIATRRSPGRALGADYEFEDGHWIYSVVVVNGKSLKEAEIDANTGKLGDIEGITAEGEGKELTNDLNRAIGKGRRGGAGGEQSEKD